MTFIPTSVPIPAHAFRPHPVLGWTIAPDARVRPGFRPGVTQTIGSDGWRVVPGRPRTAAGDLCIYGCSFTYGTGLTDEETFVALLQANLPDVRLHNRGVGGHGTVQNYLKFQSDLDRGQVSAAIFTVLSDHRFRDVPHPARMKMFLTTHWVQMGVEHLPVVRLDHNATPEIQYVRTWQPAVKRRRFDDFLPDEYMLDAATFAVLGEIERLAQAASVPIRFALLDRMDPGFNAALVSRFPHTVDASTPQDETHSFMPRDVHPNPHANRLFAEQLLPSARSLAAAIAGTAR